MAFRSGPLAFVARRHPEGVKVYAHWRRRFVMLRAALSAGIGGGVMFRRDAGYLHALLRGLGGAIGLYTGRRPVKIVDWRHTARDVAEKHRAFVVEYLGGRLVWCLGGAALYPGTFEPISWRRGNATVARVVFGERRERASVAEEREVSLPFPEGTYKATAKLRWEHQWRERLPRWTTRVESMVEIHCGVGIPVPVSGGGVTYRRLCIEKAGTISEGVAAFLASCTKERGTSWRPPMVVRQKAPAPGSLFASRFMPKHDDSAPVEWEVRNHLTGEWRPYQTCLRSALPAGAVVEEDVGDLLKLVAFTGVGALLCAAMLGPLAHLSSGRSNV